MKKDSCTEEHTAIPSFSRNLRIAVGRQLENLRACGIKICRSFRMEKAASGPHTTNDDLIEVVDHYQGVQPGGTK